MLLSSAFWRQEYKAQDKLFAAKHWEFMKEFGNGPTATNSCILNTQ